MESCPGFPFIGTGYKHPQCQDEEGALTPGSDKCLYCRAGPDVCQRGHVPEELWAALRNSLNHLSNMTSAKEKLATKVEKKKELKQDVSPKTVHTKEKAKPQRRVILERDRSQQQRQVSSWLDYRGTCFKCSLPKGNVHFSRHPVPVTKCSHPHIVAGN